MLDRQTVILALVLVAAGWTLGYGQPGGATVWKIAKTDDFSFDGTGTAEAWSETDWVIIPQRSTTDRMARNPAPLPAEPKQRTNLTTRAKMLYSESGIYFLFQCEDRMLQATIDSDYEEVWWEDVVEIFLWPDAGSPVYFEYQLSPLNHVRMTRHVRGDADGKTVFDADSPSTRHETSVEGGDRVPGASITQWIAEVFIPYEALYPAGNIPPESGTRWRANLYRFDYDTGDRTRWEWQQVDGSNHQLEKFGTFWFK